MLIAVLATASTGPPRVWRVLLAVCARNRSLSFAIRRTPALRSRTALCKEIAEALGLRTTREWEDWFNAKLRERWLPMLGRRPLWLVGDETSLPYWGKARLPEDVRGGPAKLGTTRFFCYVTVCVLFRGQRIPLGLTHWRRDETLALAMRRLLDPILAAGVCVAGVLWDRGGGNVAPMDALRELGLPFVIAAARRGPKAGVAAICGRLETEQGFGCHRPATVTMPYVLRPEKKSGREPMTVWLVIQWESVKPHRKARRQRSLRRARIAPGQRWRAVAYFTDGGDWRGRGSAVQEFYRQRQSIESSYRLSHDCRGRTSSRDPRYRLVLFAVSQLLQSTWAWLQRGLRRSGLTSYFVDMLEDLHRGVERCQELHPERWPGHPVE